MMTRLEQAKASINKALNDLYIARKSGTTTIEALYELIDIVEIAEVELKAAETAKWSW